MNDLVDLIRYDDYLINKLFVYYNKSITYNTHTISLEYNKIDSIFNFFMENKFIELQNNLTEKKETIGRITQEYVDSFVYDFNNWNRHVIYMNKEKTLFCELFILNDEKTIKFKVITAPKIKENLRVINNMFNLFKNKGDKNYKFYQIAYSNPNYHMLDFKIKIPTIKNYYYNNLNIDNIIDIINNDNNGLLLFSGIPGSGKTTLIKHLISKSDKKFCNFSIDNIEMFNSPTLQTFLSNNLKDSVLILEDCEKLIKSRKTTNNNINTLLNLSDGLLGEALNLKIILTYNISNDIDEALLRKGRLLFKHDFDLLTIENANKLSKELGYNVNYDKKPSLTDVFNENENNYSNIKNKIGF